MFILKTCSVITKKAPKPSSVLELRWFFPSLASFCLSSLSDTTLQPGYRSLMWTHEITKSALYLCSVVVKCQSMMSEKEFKLSLSVGLSRACSFFLSKESKRCGILGFAVCVGHRPLEGSIVTVVFELWELGLQWTRPHLVLCLPALMQMHWAQDCLGSWAVGRGGCLVIWQMCTFCLI